MLPNFTEIVLILFIVAIVFGVGKFGSLGHAAGKIKANFQKGHDAENKDEDPIDITPSEADTRQEYDGPKPGTADQPIEDAELVD